ncbi:hypothetical protein [Ferrovibrio terrae]|uniref:hypothetical protein n=1 Tax=Ferrovibrio terrae TaxID=2594003 RepID=UPI003137F675
MPKKPTQAPVKTGPDWGAIKRHWVAGIRSIRDIAKEAGITHRAVSEYAKRHEWPERSLAQKIRDTAKDKTARKIAEETRASQNAKPTIAPVATERQAEGGGPSQPERVANTDARAIRAEPDIDEAEIVELNAVAQSEVTAIHRRDARVQRQMIGRLLLELDHTTARRDEIEAEIEAETQKDTNGTRRAAMMRAVSLPSRAGVMRDLATALTKVVGLERQAFGMVDADPNRPSGSGAPLASRLTQIDQQRRVETETTTTPQGATVVKQTTTLQQRLRQIS